MQPEREKEYDSEYKEEDDVTMRPKNSDNCK